MKKLADSVLALCQIQERALQQTTSIEQRKQSGLQKVHYTITKKYKRLGTIDEISPSLDITPLALEALGSRKKTHAYNILLLAMNAKKTRCFMIPRCSTPSPHAS